MTAMLSDPARTRHRRHLQRCPMSGKVRFRDKTEAVVVLHRAATARAYGTEHRRECRSYRCRECSGWHVTSMPEWTPPTAA